MLLLVCVTVLVATSGRVAAPVDASPLATRIVDRTLRCTTGIQGGVPVILVNARRAYGDGGKLDWFSQVYVVAGGQPVPNRRGFQPTLAGLTAGWPPPEGFASGGLSFHNRRCVPTRERVGFSRRGLQGGAAGYFGDDYQCRVPRTMLVRVRAVFREPVDLRLIGGRTFYSADGRISQGQLAVQTISKKPVVYGEVTESGRAQLFTAGSCL